MFLQEVELAFDLFSNGKHTIDVTTLWSLLNAIGVFISEADHQRLREEFNSRGAFTYDDVLQVIKVSSTEDMQSYQAFTGLQSITHNKMPLTPKILLDMLTRIGIPPLTLTNEEIHFLFLQLVLEDDMSVNIDELLRALRFE